MILRTVEVPGTGELQFQRTDYDNGDRWYAVVFYPRPTSPDEQAANDYRPLSYYHVAWARLPRREEFEPIAVVTNHDLVVVLGMAEQGANLPQVSVERIEHVEPVLEFIGRAFATAFDARRRGGLELFPTRA
jgi:hypothetical protein